jgi:hypothetical protein
MAVPKENLDLEAGRQVGQVDQTGEPCLEKIDRILLCGMGEKLQ